MNWSSIPSTELNIHATLACGQAFRWDNLPAGDWIGVIDRSLVRIIPKDNGFYWQTYPTSDQWDLIYEYFSLSVNLEEVYASWPREIPAVSSSIANNRGLRILRQNPEETLFSFLCATNNSILKIRRSVRLLAQRTGSPIAEWNGTEYNSFPCAEVILNIPEEQLRQDKWGYRAPILLGAAAHFANEGPQSISTLACLPYEDLVDRLIDVKGIGLKLADCISLFGFGCSNAVPVDTHVRRIGVETLQFHQPTKSLTAGTYKSLADQFRVMFGKYAGWAQQYLFYDSLSQSTIENKTSSK